MKKEYKKALNNSRTSIKANTNFLKKAKKIPKRQLDTLFREEHDKVFEKVHCLECANCCKTTSPIFGKMDIKRLARLFRMKDFQFIEEYLKMDGDGDYVLKSSPCTFLLDDNTCFVYENRPSACREYPHTNRKNMYQILDLVKSNTFICPAVAEIVENIRVKKEI